MIPFNRLYNLVPPRTPEVHQLNGNKEAAYRCRVLVVDDNPFFLRCLKDLIDREPDMMVCGVATSSTELFKAIKSAKPDMIVLDIMLGMESGLMIGETLRRQGVTVPVLFISALATPNRKLLQQIGRCAFSRKDVLKARQLRNVRNDFPNGN